MQTLQDDHASDYLSHVTYSLVNLSKISTRTLHNPYILPFVGIFDRGSDGGSPGSETTWLLPQPHNI